MVLSGLIALPAALFGLAAVLLRRGNARGWGAAALLLSAFPMGLGAAGTLLGRMQAGDAVQNIAAGYLRARALREGLREARVCSQGGLVLGAFPLVAGAAAVLAAPPRRTQSTRPRRGQAHAAGAAAHSARPESQTGVLRGLKIAFAVALMAAAGALWGACAPIPDPDLEPTLGEPQ
jgi:hypothetical protein